MLGLLGGACNNPYLCDHKTGVCEVRGVLFFKLVALLRVRKHSNVIYSGTSFFL